MQKFFVFGCEIEQKEIDIVGDDAHHISHSLRMKPGDRITVCDGRGNDFDCELVSFSAERVSALVRGVSPSVSEPGYSAVLYQALPKGDKMDVIVQKAVELGVRRIVPFESGFCVAKAGATPDRKLARWRRIAYEAAKQCGRGIVPEVSRILDFRSAADEVSKSECPFICYEGEGTQPLGRVAQPGRGEYAFIVGSEGGFSDGEIELAARAGIPAVGLGKRILRCETASGFVLSCLCMENELR